MGSRLRLHLVRAPAVVLGVVTLTFVLLHAAPGDPVSLLLGPQATPEQLAAAARALGLEGPPIAQYARWLGRAATGDFGVSIATGRPVSSMLAEAWPPTALLVGLSILLSQILGLAAAVWQAVTRRRQVDSAVSVATVTMAAMPGYWLAFVMVLIFTYWLRLLPAFGAAGLDADLLPPLARLGDRLAHLALPLATLTIIGIGTTARYARGALVAIRHAPFLAVARAKGIHPRRVLIRHHLRNGLIPVVTLLGLSLPALFSGAVFVETVFAWPGIGQLLVQAVRARDYPVVMAATTVSAVLVVAGSLLAEALLARVDPRTRT